MCVCERDPDREAERIESDFFEESAWELVSAKTRCQWPDWQLLPTSSTLDMCSADASDNCRRVKLSCKGRASTTTSTKPTAHNFRAGMYQPCAHKLEASNAVEMVESRAEA